MFSPIDYLANSLSFPSPMFDLPPSLCGTSTKEIQLNDLIGFGVALTALRVSDLLTILSLSSRKLTMFRRYLSVPILLIPLHSVGNGHNC